ncbi:MAG: DUF434 domain-containing protein [Syntrophobacter sp.]
MTVPSLLPPARKWNLFHAAADFFHLLNRDYPRQAALEMVGNRYGLPAMERQLLHRGIFSRDEALSRRAKRENGAGWLRKPLAVDGHNVQITLESHIEERMLLHANDGAVRDLAGQSSRFRFSETSRIAMETIFRFLREFRPLEVLFFFDAPMSRSGEMASMYHDSLRKAGIRGDARAVAVPEREFPYSGCVVASSDRAVIDASEKWIDLAEVIMRYSSVPVLTADFSNIILPGSAERQLFADGGPFW